MTERVIIFSDGASKGTPGQGGWGAIVASEKRVVELGDSEPHTTNNRMELTAAIRALENADENLPATVNTDSSYVINGVTKWLSDWKRRDWKTLQKKAVMNEDLWRELNEILEWRTAPVKWNYVGGHIGIAGNERVDEIASAFAKGESAGGMRLKLFSGARSRYGVDIADVSANTARSAKKSASKSRSRATAYSYVSMVDGKIEVHKTWAECEKRVKGVSEAKFKKSLSAEDEKDIISSWM